MFKIIILLVVNLCFAYHISRGYTKCLVNKKSKRLIGFRYPCIVFSRSSAINYFFKLNKYKILIINIVIYSFL